MRLYLANTDYDWFRFLSAQIDLDEANFWRPSGKKVVGYLSFGDPFVFKLKKAYEHAIVGFGFFVAYARLSVLEAWDTFGQKNGAPSLDVMWRRVAKYAFRNEGAPYRPTHYIGCDLLASPTFFPEELWIRGPADWSDNNVSGKGYDIAYGEGQRIWRECLNNVALLGPELPPNVAEQPTLFEPYGTAPRFGAEQVVRPRLGQGTFRFAVQETYRKCAVTREHSLPALDASHIIPYSAGGQHEIPNGILLRADIHRLFDRGYVTVTPDYRFRVSPHLADEFHNGRVYYQLEGTQIWRPRNEADWPRRDHLERHNDEVFLT